MIAINWDLRLYMDEHGNVFPITNWIDEDGDECEPADAITCVAGNEDTWYSIDLRQWRDAPVDEGEMIQ